MVAPDRRLRLLRRASRAVPGDDHLAVLTPAAPAWARLVWTKGQVQRQTGVAGIGGGGPATIARRPPLRNRAAPGWAGRFETGASRRSVSSRHVTGRERAHHRRDAGRRPISAKRLRKAGRREASMAEMEDRPPESHDLGDRIGPCRRRTAGSRTKPPRKRAELRLHHTAYASARSRPGASGNMNGEEQAGIKGSLTPIWRWAALVVGAIFKGPPSSGPQGGTAMRSWMELNPRSGSAADTSSGRNSKAPFRPARACQGGMGSADRFIARARSMGGPDSARDRHGGPARRAYPLVQGADLEKPEIEKSNRQPARFVECRAVRSRALRISWRYSDGFGAGGPGQHGGAPGAIAPPAVTSSLYSMELGANIGQPGDPRRKLGSRAQP